MPGDLYGVLGVPRGATTEEIKKAYRAMARQYHPDKNPNDEEAAQTFKDAAEAWRVLGDNELRAKYDSHGMAPSRAAVEENPADIFEEIFGAKSGSQPPPRSADFRHSGGPSAPRSPDFRAAGPAGSGGAAGAPHARTRPQPPPSNPRPIFDSQPPPQRRKPAGERGEDLRYRLEIDFADAVFGAERTISVTRRERCPLCGGSGAEPGTRPVACGNCAGTGAERTQQGFFSSSHTCPVCAGLGRVVEHACGDCRGSGEVRLASPLAVAVPGGVDTGTRLKVAGEGEPGKHGGPAGDLFVVLEVRPHPLFQREGNDILVEVPIRFAQAALGDTIEIPTLDGVVRMRVPGGSQSGRVFRLKGKGMLAADGRRGDQRVRVVIDVPDEVPDDERAALERFDRLHAGRGGSPRIREFQEKLSELGSGAD